MEGALREAGGQMCDPVFHPVQLSAAPPFLFPDPRLADREGLVAFGGGLEPERLLLAYRSGIFPWPAEGLPMLWWSPDPRAILPPDRLHVSRSLARTLRRRQFTLSWNQRFDEVMAACGEREEGSWVTPWMQRAYGALHRLGHAHSLEVTMDGALVGGLYGVQVGALFAAESMFHRVTDMSKVALVAAVRSLARAGIQLFEVQFVTPHLQSMGAVPIARHQYLQRLKGAVAQSVNLDRIQPESC